MIEALEPRPRGRRRGAEEEVVRLTGEKEKLEREVGRLSSLVRASRRSLGVSSLKGKPKAKGKRRRRGHRGRSLGVSSPKSKPKAKSRRRGHRGKKVVAMLVRPSDEGESGETKAS